MNESKKHKQADNNKIKPFDSQQVLMLNSFAMENEPGSSQSTL